MEEKTYIFEGKTTNEAIEIGLKKLNVSKNQVEIKVLENEDKRSFFSILTPRVVKVELTLKDEIKNEFRTIRAKLSDNQENKEIIEKEKILIQK